MSNQPSLEGRVMQPKPPLYPRVGMRVIRKLGGEVPMPMIICAVTDEHVAAWPVASNGQPVLIPYRFLRKTGGEIDPDLGWDGIHTGSFIEEDFEHN